MRAKSRVVTAAVAPFVVQATGVINVVFAGIFVVAVVLAIVAPVPRFVICHDTAVAFGFAYKTSSYNADVLTGKLAPRSETVGAVPLTFHTIFQLPVLVLIAIPTLPGVVLVSGSTLVGAVVGVS